MASQPLLTPRGWGGEHLWAAPPRLPLPLQSPLTASARLAGGAAPGSEPACCPHTAPYPGPILSRARGCSKAGPRQAEAALLCGGFASTTLRLHPRFLS